MSEKCENCGRDESPLPRALSIESCVSNLREDVKELRERLDEAVRLLEAATKRGTCWCGVGIGHPLVHEHSPTCSAVAAFLAQEKR